MASAKSSNPPHLGQHEEINSTGLACTVEDEIPQSPSTTNFDANLDVEDSPVLTQHRKFFETRGCTRKPVSTSNNLQLPIPQLELIDDTGFSFAPVHQKLNALSSAPEAELPQQETSRPQTLPRTTNSVRASEDDLPTNQFEVRRPREDEKAMNSPHPGNRHDPSSKEQQGSNTHLNFSNVHRVPVPTQMMPADSDRVVDLTQSPAAIKLARANQTPHRSISTRTATILHGRISKAPRENLSQRRNAHLPCDGPKITHQPSEEDLLFLLMSRLRKTDTALKRLDYLEHENEDLRQERVQTDAKLQEAISAHRECARESSLLSRNMATFREKYYKLKKWALETNKDCEELQQKALGLERTLVDLTNDRDQLFTRLQDVKATSESASTQLENIRDGIHDTKLMANDCIAGSNLLSGLIMEKDDELRKQEHRCRKLDIHIVHLEKERDMQNVRMHSQQQELHQALQLVFEKLRRLNDGKPEQTAKDDCISEDVRRIKSMLSVGLAKSSDFGPLKESLQATTTSLAAMMTSATENLQEAISRFKGDLQHGNSAEMANLLSAVSDLGSLLEARAEVARLKEKELQTEKRADLFQNAKVAAEERAISIEKTAEAVVDALNRDNEALRKKTNDLATTSSELRIKWQAISSQLEKCKQEKFEVEEERDELNAELTDSLGLLAEAAEEDLSLRSTLSNVEDDATRAIVEIEQECHETVAHMECRLRHLQSDLDHEIQERGQLEKSFDMAIQYYDWLLVGFCGDIEVALREEGILEAEIADLYPRLACAEDAVKTLGHPVSDLTVAKSEILQLKEELLSQSKEIEAKSLEAQTLRKDLEKACTKAALLEAEVRQKEEIVAENAALQKQLDQLQSKASMAAVLQNELEQKKNEVTELQNSLVIAQQQAQDSDRLSKENAAIKIQVDILREELLVLPDLQKRLQQKETHMSDLQSALRASQQQAQDKDKLAKENALMAERLKQTEEQVSHLRDVQMELQQERAKTIALENDLASAKTQATHIDELQEKLTSLQEQRTSLTSQLKHSNEECAQIPPLKQSIKEKDDELAKLQEQSITLQDQAEEIQRLRDDLQQAEEKHVSMQQQILGLEGELSNARLDEAGNEPPQQRRVATRTGGFGLPTLSAPIRPAPLVDHDSLLSDGGDLSQLVVGSSLQPTGVTTIVPETQPEIQESPLVEADSLLPTSCQQESSDSEFSLLPSDDESSSPENESQHLIVKARRSLVDRGHRVVDQAAGEAGPMLERPPSSSYESQSDQMLLDQVSQSEDVNSDQLPSTIRPEFAISSSQIKSGQEHSPRRLRSGSRGLGRQATRSVEPDYQYQRTRASTPIVRREQYQPNSAAKRRMEPEIEEDGSQENLRKLKRRPANMEIKTPQFVVPKQPAKQTPSRGTVSFRKSSSIVGTDAPAPGKSQRSTKLARKGSRQDRYATRFGHNPDGNET